MPNTASSFILWVGCKTVVTLHTDSTWSVCVFFEYISNIVIVNIFIPNNNIKLDLFFSNKVVYKLSSNNMQTKMGYSITSKVQGNQHSIDK